MDVDIRVQTVNQFWAWEFFKHCCACVFAKVLCTKQKLFRLLLLATESMPST